jgi:hypothetical protein
MHNLTIENQSFNLLKRTHSPTHLASAEHYF